MCHEADALLFVDDTGLEDWPQMLKWEADDIQTDQPEELIGLLKSSEGRR